MATGIFAGLLPSVGSSEDFSTPFSNDLTIDYDFGDLGGSNPDVVAEFGKDDEATVAQPGAVFLLGLVALGLASSRRSIGD